jgi:predicted flap endonuclease-1-like 5' DNA nuclease
MPLLDEWGNSIQESVRGQMALLQDWSKMANFKKLSSKELTELTDQIGKSMQKSIETQQQLWNQWFATSRITALSRPAGPKVPAAATVKRPAKRRSTAAKPAAAKERRTAATDDLKQIVGIGPGLEKKLNGVGISSIEQIAELSAEDITRLEETVSRFSGRIAREKWVEQAKALVEDND